MVVDANTGFPITAPNKGEYGSSQRDFMMGLQNTFTYKDFQLGFSFDYRKGGMFYSGTADLLLFTGGARATTYNDRKPFVVPNSVNQTVDGSGKTIYVENTKAISQANYDAYFYHTSNKALSYRDRIIDRSFPSSSIRPRGEQKSFWMSIKTRAVWRGSTSSSRVVKTLRPKTSIIGILL